jgi:hypothetical protein
MPGICAEDAWAEAAMAVRWVKGAAAQKNQLGHFSIDPSSAPMLCISRSAFCRGCRKSMIGRESLTGVAKGTACRRPLT